MIIAVRISGRVNMKESVEEALSRIRLRRKYRAVLLKDTEENRKILLNLRNFIAYGPASKELMEILIEKRGESKTGKKVDAAKVIAQIEKTGVEDSDIEPFFALHPPIGGAETKNHFGVGKGVLGDNKEKIEQLVRRML